MKSLLATLALGSALAAAAPAQNLILRLAPTTAPASVATKYGIVLKDVTPGAPFALYTTKSAAEAERIQTLMLNDTGIVWAEDDGLISAPESLARSGQRPTHSAQKGSILPSVGDRKKLQATNAASLAKIKWNAALSIRSGRAVRLAILDTGLASTATGLWAKTVAAVNYVEPGLPAYDSARGLDTNRDGLVDGGTGHGTMVAGIADQVAPEVKLVIARVANSDGDATGWTVIKGLAFAVVNGAEVANVSLGSLEGIPALNDTMDWCEEKGLFVVAPVGNNAIREACYPGRISKVLCVAGLNLDGTKASFSNWDGKVDLAAPAVGFASLWVDGGSATWSGTSFAAPLVAAAYADALRSTTGRQRPDTLHRLARTNGTDLNRLNPKYKDRLGRLLDVGGLIRALGGPRP